jgi:hypothetical protein
LRIPVMSATHSGGSRQFLKNFDFAIGVFAGIQVLTMNIVESIVAPTAAITSAVFRVDIS